MSEWEVLFLNYAFDKLQKIDKVVQNIFIKISMFLLFTMFVLMAIQIFRRFVLNDAYFWVEEICRTAQIWVVFLMSPVVLQRGMHPGFQGIPNLLGYKGKKTIWIISMVIVIIVGWWLTYYGILLMETSTFKSPNGIPRWVAVMPVVIGGFWSIIVAIIKIVTIIKLTPEEVIKWKL